MSDDRLQRAAGELARAGIDALLVGPSADLRYLIGYDPPPLERMTLLAVRPDEPPFLVVPVLERPRAEATAAGVEIVAWGETEDPVVMVGARLGDVPVVAVDEHLWAMFLLRLQEAFPKARFTTAAEVMRSLRVRKEADEIDALRRAAAAADSVARAIASENVGGRTEKELSRWIGEALVDAGCSHPEFAIVAAGPNAASPHHEPSERVIAPGDSLVCDFGGPIDGYHSDITRTFFVGTPPAEFASLYAVLKDAQDAGVAAVAPGVACSAVDAAARAVIDKAGYGEYFIHRTGHGIGLEVHEHPYLVTGNDAPLEPGMAFSIEPGIYLPGRFGARIEDIVVCTPSGGERLNNAPRDLVVLA